MYIDGSIEYLFLVLVPRFEGRFLNISCTISGNFLSIKIYLIMFTVFIYIAMCIGRIFISSIGSWTFPKDVFKIWDFSFMHMGDNLVQKTSFLYHTVHKDRRMGTLNSKTCTKNKEKFFDFLNVFNFIIFWIRFVFWKQWIEPNFGVKILHCKLSKI